MKMHCLILFLMPFLMFAQGKATHGSSLLFNGTSTYVDCGAGASLDISDSITIECWVKPKGGTWANDGYVFAKRNNSTKCYSVNIGATTKLLGWNIGGSDFAAGVVDLPIWYHLVCTSKTGTNNTITYLNGVATVLNPSVTLTSSPTLNLCLGARWSVYPGTTFLSALSIKDFRIYNRTMSQSEVTWNYNHPEKPFSTSQLKLWYKFNEYNGTSLADSSGNANTGTIVFGTWSIDTPVKSGGN